MLCCLKGLANEVYLLLHTSNNYDAKFLSSKPHEVDSQFLIQKKARETENIKMRKFSPV